MEQPELDQRARHRSAAVLSCGAFYALAPSSAPGLFQSSEDKCPCDLGSGRRRRGEAQLECVSVDTKRTSEVFAEIFWEERTLHVVCDGRGGFVDAEGSEV